LPSWDWQRESFRIPKENPITINASRKTQNLWKCQVYQNSPDAQIMLISSSPRSLPKD
jgi:hypothetical protein